MELGTIPLIFPLISVAIFSFFEKITAGKASDSKKFISIFALHGLNVLLVLALSTWVLLPLVVLTSAWQIFSFSELEVPVWISFTASLLFLDFIHYLSHRIQHKISFLWRIHRLHHSDRQVDTFTTLLHHPLEMAISFIVLVLFAVFFDIPTVAIVCYAVIAGIHSGFTHMTCRLPNNIEKILSYILVTPKFHRIHHSRDVNLGNSNYSMVLTIWDSIFDSASTESIANNDERLGIDDDQSPQKISVFAYIGNPIK
jgi:sterol desaturase/sphingolipid hydroxylase (fatty acid hydroxylase superfamily)